MNKTLLLTFILILAIVSSEGKKSFKSRSSGRSSSSRRNSQPSPTSHSYPQPASAPKASAPKPTLFGWQEKPAQRTQSIPKQSKPTNTHSYPSTNTQNKGHSYPSSQTGLSGNSPPKQTQTNQESIQRSHATQNNAAGQGAAQPVNAQGSHSYPASTGLSGNTGTGHGYPQQGSGLSGSGQAPPPYSGPGAAPPPYSSSGVAPPPYNSYNKPGYNNYQGSQGGYNHGGNYHPQGPPPGYSGYGGHGGPGYGGPGYGAPQMPGYFGGYGGRSGFGGVSRGPSMLTGVGIAGAGIGTVLTGLALWNLARSTGRQHHTVIYDNRGQPVAVAPDNGTEPVVDPMLADLVNCSLTMTNEKSTEVVAIPCAIATSFTPDADVKELDNANPDDTTRCIITVMKKSGKEYMTTIPCSVLLNTAKENNVTEPPLPPVDSAVVDAINGTNMTLPIGSNAPNTPLLDASLSVVPNQPLPGSVPDQSNLNCTIPSGSEVQDPMNPCVPVTHNLTVIPLEVTNVTTISSTPSAA